MRETEIQTYKRESIKAAKDLLYGKSVIDEIRKADSITKIINIMQNARKEKFSNE